MQKKYKTSKYFYIKTCDRINCVYVHKLREMKALYTQT